MNETLLKVKEVAEILRCSRSWAYSLVQSGELASVWMGRKRLVPRSALDALMKSGTTFNIKEAR